MSIYISEINKLSVLHFIVLINFTNIQYYLEIFIKYKLKCTYYILCD